MRWRAIVAYDGTDFVGWQTQNGRGRTVQEEIEKALATVLRDEVRVEAAGRTDSGVHARGQVIAFDTDREIEEVAARTLYSLNALLPREVVVSQLEPTRADFDPRRDAVRRTYCYRIWNGIARSPFEVRTAWHVHGSLDVEAMDEAAAAVVGRHDFATFQTSDKIERPSVREVFLASVSARESLVVFSITANAFCRGMVRNLVGQLVAIGRGQSLPAGMKDLLVQRDRSLAAAAAPPQGLFLERVDYE